MWTASRVKNKRKRKKEGEETRKKKESLHERRWEKDRMIEEGGGWWIRSKAKKKSLNRWPRKKGRREEKIQWLWGYLRVKPSPDFTQLCYYRKCTLVYFILRGNIFVKILNDSFCFSVNPYDTASNLLTYSMWWYIDHQLKGDTAAINLIKTEGKQEQAWSAANMEQICYPVYLWWQKKPHYFW